MRGDEDCGGRRENGRRRRGGTGPAVEECVLEDRRGRRGTTVCLCAHCVACPVGWKEGERERERQTKERETALVLAFHPPPDSERPGRQRSEVCPSLLSEPSMSE